ncbi:unnamed protein product [Prorocentrum cordatum]|uniref:Calmodulin n=1 Tax=Prorocentrum cordatum TaxID=2364126 RepID=A0ABN9RQE6_9DINO|nr:unnamed protein product [Polarella glacialis]
MMVGWGDGPPPPVGDGLVLQRCPEIPITARGSENLCSYSFSFLPLEEALADLDSSGSGRLDCGVFCEALCSFGVAPVTAEQVVCALSADGAGAVTYGFFVAVCVDLVEDKLDHMLWKLFSLVDEDHGGEMNQDVLEHFLQGALHGDGGERDRDGDAGDIATYLQGVLDPDLCVNGFASAVAGPHGVVEFERLKQRILDESVRDLRGRPPGRTNRGGA